MKSKELAKLIGPTLVVMTASEMMNLKIWAANIPAVTYLNGIILFVSGLSIVRIHNHWVPKWQVVITVLGWGAITGGVFRIFFPEARQGGQNLSTYVLISMLFFIGVFLVYKGYVVKKDHSSQ